MVTQAENELLQRARGLLETEDRPVPASGYETPAPTLVGDTIVECIVVDKDGQWCPRVPVDLGGVPTASFEWEYYGQWYPVLVEGKEDGVLRPWYLPDKAGRDPSKLYIAEKQEGYRGAWKTNNPMLKKIQIGLMVALVAGLFGLMFLFVKG